MNTFKWVAALVLVGLASSNAVAQLTLTGTVRDFKAASEAGGHPDFESFITGVAPGIVEDELGPDGTPIYAHGPASFGGVTNAASFDQWFHDTPGVNLSTTYPITLTETAPGSGIYTFTSSEFFPIDDMLFGNYDGYTHNYHFTYTIAGTFDYLAGTGQVFSFEGDDDVWTFLDNTLAIDLGGVHGSAGASVDLDTFMSGKPSGTYPFDFFFAERHTVGSNFTMTTSAVIIPEPSSGLLLMAGMAVALAIRLGRRTKRGD
jgi:fibro-slime domain-containing protein